MLCAQFVWRLNFLPRQEAARRSIGEAPATGTEMQKTIIADRARERKQKMLEYDVRRCIRARLHTHSYTHMHTHTHTHVHTHTQATHKRDPVILEEELEEKRQKDAMLARAKQAMDSEHDDVKHMNQLILYAKCVTIRDQQIMEKVPFRPCLWFAFLCLFESWQPFYFGPDPLFAVVHVRRKSCRTRRRRRTAAQTCSWRCALCPCALSCTRFQLHFLACFFSLLLSCVFDVLVGYN